MSITLAITIGVVLGLILSAAIILAAFIIGRRNPVFRADGSVNRTPTLKQAIGIREKPSIISPHKNMEKRQFMQAIPDASL